MKKNTLKSISKLSPVLDEIKLIESFERIRQHYDEPKFWYYSATINDRHLKQDGSHFFSKASGVSFFSQEEAILKALAEAIERYGNFAFFEKDVDFVGSYSEIKNGGIDPEKFIYFSDGQINKKDYQQFRINRESLFRWTEVASLFDQKKHLAPCQTIYLSYRPIAKEPIIYPNISTGAAGHSTLNLAILGGIYEILERDAFMIYYLNKLKPKKYNLESTKNDQIKKLLEIADRYHLEIFSIDIKTDLEIPAVASVVVDRSGLGKAISVGLKSSLDIESAIIGSINEAFHTRTWVRESYIKNPVKITKTDLIKNSSIKNRGLFWYNKEAISKIDFFIKDLEKIDINLKDKGLSTKKQLIKIEAILKKKGYDVYYKDITPKYFEKIPFKVVKVIIPGMHPMYLDEKYPLLAGKRLKNVPVVLGYKNSNKLNDCPHPFL